MAARDLLVVRYGRRPWTEVLAVQRAAARARIEGTLAQDLLILCEHPPVITLGRAFKKENLTAPQALLDARGVEVHEAERGGDITFHGPGQLVGYPIVDLQVHKPDLHWYLRMLEEACIRVCDDFGIEAGRQKGQTGVWVEGRKIASIGVHARQWVTWHGFALNVTTDLSFFDLMVPCGIADVRMTSIAAELAGRGEPVADALNAQVERAAIAAMAAILDLGVDELSPEALQLFLTPAVA
ncbi:MAG: lipoyl(octanoyl) transferase LipB [Gemmatimonadetes bacterium]|nr:lipoyl(octanoyl) transferase LipB [Gemmatimonadota bacterium]